MISVAEAELIGLILHSCLIGLYFILFFQSLPFDMDEDYNIRRRSYNRVLFGVNISLFLTITTHWIIQILRAYQAFITTVGEPGDAATFYYAFPAATLNLVKESLYLTQTFIGDCTMIYRLWVVWNRNYAIIVVPAMIVMAYAVSAIAVVIALGQTVMGQDIFISTAGRWAITVFTTSVSTNVITTVLITYRIFTVRSQVRGITYNRSGVMSVVHIIIESAALYTTMAVLTLIGYSTKQTWQFITIDMISPIIGISFTLIAVRISRSVNSPPNTTGGVSSNMIRFRPGENRRDTIGLDTISVNVTQQVSKHTDLETSAGTREDESETKARAF